MAPTRRLGLALVVLAATGSGCAQSGGLRAPGAGMGSLRASVSHLEFENQQLRKEVATIKEDNRKVENRLAQEEAANGDLSARLDDARVLLSRRGLDAGAASDALDPGPPRRTLPAGQSSRRKRKTPFAQIPGPVDVLPPEDDGSSNWNHSNAADDQSQLERPMNWLPIARGAVAPKTR